jgi:hypothetical protein
MLSVRVASVPDRDYINHRFGFENAVDDSIVAAAYAKQIVGSMQFARSRRPRFFGEPLDPSEYASSHLDRDARISRRAERARTIS